MTEENYISKVNTASRFILIGLAYKDTSNEIGFIIIRIINDIYEKDGMDGVCETKDIMKEVNSHSFVEVAYKDIS